MGDSEYIYLEISDSIKSEYFEEWLRMATKKQDLCMMRKLIEELNVDPNAEDAEEGFTSIHIAAAQSDATTLLFFLSLTTKINVNAQVKSGQTPLLKAIIYGCEEVVRILLAPPNLDVNLTDYCGRTALMLACFYGRKTHAKTIVSMLLDHEHIQVNKAEFNDGETALMIAINEHHPELVRLLLTRDDINNKHQCSG